MARIVDLIEVEEHEGNGTEANPYRIVTRYYSLDGELVADDEHLPTNKTSKENE